MHGGMGMGIGWSLFEEMIIDAKTGVVRNPNLLDYKFPTMLDLPELECDFVQTYEPQSVYGHKSLGNRPSFPPALPFAMPSAWRPASPSTSCPSPPRPCFGSLSRRV